MTHFNTYVLIRWYYWTDKLGLLVWQDFPCITDTISMEEAAGEAKEVFRGEARRWLGQLGHHPSIILWVVFNEGWGQHDTVSLTNMVMEVGIRFTISFTNHREGLGSSLKRLLLLSNLRIY